MASRNMTAAVLTEIAKDQTFPFFLLEVVFDVTPITLASNTVRLTTAYNDITFNGETWFAVGHFLGFTPVRETMENRITKLSVQLSGVDQSNISEFLSREYINRPIRVYLGFINFTGYTVIVDPFLLFDGLMSDVAINDDPVGGTSIVVVDCVDHWEAFNTKPGRHTNNDEQQSFFPGDAGFEFVAKVPRNLKWGRK